MFDVSNSDNINDVKTREIRLLAVSVSLCYGISSLCEILIVLLLCSRSIGKNDFTRSLAVGSCWSLLTFVGLVMVIIVLPSNETSYMMSRSMYIGILIRNGLTSLMGAFCIVFFYVTKSDRMSILTFSTYLCPIYLVKTLSQGLVLTEDFIAINFGRLLILSIIMCKVIIHMCFIAVSIRNLYGGFVRSPAFYYISCDMLLFPETRLSILEYRCG